VILEKSCSETSQQKDHDMAAKRNNTWQQKCPDIRTKKSCRSRQKCPDIKTKMSPSQDALHIYLKN